MEEWCQNCRIVCQGLQLCTGSRLRQCAVLQALVKCVHVCCVPRTGLCSLYKVLNLQYRDSAPGGLWVSSSGPGALKTGCRTLWVTPQEA